MRSIWMDAHTAEILRIENFEWKKMVEDSVLDSKDFQSMRPLGYRIMAVIIGDNALRIATSVL